MFNWRKKVLSLPPQLRGELEREWRGVGEGVEQPGIYDFVITDLFHLIFAQIFGFGDEIMGK
jgi:hypothetical protein